MSKCVIALRGVPPREPAADIPNQAEIRCPLKGGQVIAAERCVQNVDCPRAANCPFRTIAVAASNHARSGLTARRPGNNSRLVRATRYCKCGKYIKTTSRYDSCLACRRSGPADCKWCEKPFARAKPSQDCCSEEHAKKHVAYLAGSRLQHGYVTEERGAGR
jgi:hypothetical protein